MFHKLLLNSFLLSSLFLGIVESDGRFLQSFNLDVKNMMVFGSGCPEESVNIVSSTDEKTVTILFSNYYAETSDSKTFDRKSCNIAVPFNIDPNKQVALYKIDYRGYTWLPSNNNNGTAVTNFGVEYFFAGTKGPVVL